ncbi:MAG: type II secretion system protein, partial [Proteobacteria bacterium]|nr:type II secretion system protein [Pseudomonadota bacterium]
MKFFKSIPKSIAHGGMSLVETIVGIGIMGIVATATMEMVSIKQRAVQTQKNAGKIVDARDYLRRKVDC